MTQTPTVHAALVAVMRDVQGLGKHQRNSAPGGNYNFRGIDAVMNAVGPALREHSLAVIASCRSAEYAEILVGKDRRPMAHSRVVMEYTLIGPDGSTLSGSAPGEAFDSGDKATAKACSVAYRTWLLQTLCLPTDEPDPDASTHERAPSARDVVLTHHKGDFGAAVEAATAAGFANLRDPAQLSAYAAHLTGGAQ